MVYFFWAVVPGRERTPFEVAGVAIIQLMWPSTHNRLIMRHIDQVGQMHCLK